MVVNDVWCVTVNHILHKSNMQHTAPIEEHYVTTLTAFHRDIINIYSLYSEGGI